MVKMKKILLLLLLSTAFSLKAQTKKDVESAVTKVYFSIIESKQTSVGGVQLIAIKNNSLAFIVNIKTPTDSQRKVKQFLYIFRNLSDLRPVLMFTDYNKTKILKYLNENDWITIN